MFFIHLLIKFIIPCIVQVSDGCIRLQNLHTREKGTVPGGVCRTRRHALFVCFVNH